jgi:hypothetical protein
MTDGAKTTALRDVWEGARCMIARGLLRCAVWVLPNNRIRPQLRAVADAWREQVERRLANEQ